MLKTTKAKSRFFLIGLFISSLGSTSFLISILTFLPNFGVKTAVVGLIVGASRITSVFTNFLFGPIGDRINSKKLVIVCEVGAMICSILIYKLSFELSNSNYLVFILFIGLRSFFTGLQQSSIQKIGKQFDESLLLNGSFAKKLNQVTFGSIFFATILNLVAAKMATFQIIIIIDAISFLINGIILSLSAVNATSFESLFNFEKRNLMKTWRLNKKYFSLNQDLYVQDILLALVMMGANTLNVLMLSTNVTLIPFASGIFGLSVWLAPIVDKKLSPKQTLCWFTLSASIALQILFIYEPVYVLCLSFIRNLSYWLIFNHASMLIMQNSAKEHFASISSGRNVSINLIGAVGEFWTGLQYLALLFELAWRSLLAMGGYLFYNRRRLSYFAFALWSFLLSERSKGTELKLPIRSVNVNTDPQLMEDVYSLTVNRQIYRGLLKFTSSLEIIPDLADTYNILDGGRRIRFKLRPSVFSDGTKITGKDIQNTFKRIVKFNAGIKTDLRAIHKFMELKDITSAGFGVKVVSDDTIDIILDYPDPFIFKNLAAVDCSIVKTDNELNLVKGVYSGYYAIDKKSENEILLRLQESKSLGSPSLIKLIQLESDYEAQQSAKGGLLDSLDIIEVNDKVRNTLLGKGWKSFSGKTVRTIFLSANPLSLEENLRKYIFNLIYSLNFGPEISFYEKTYGLVPNLLAGSLSKDDFIINKKSVETDRKKEIIFYIPKNDEGIKLGNLVKKALSKSGLKVKVVEFPIEKYFDVVRERKYDLILRSKYLDYPDGMSFLTYFKSNIPINTFNAGTKEIDSLIEKAQKESSSKLRSDLYKLIQIKLLSEYTLIPLLNGSTGSGLWSEKVDFIPGHPLGFSSLNFSEIRMKSD